MFWKNQWAVKKQLPGVLDTINLRLPGIRDTGDQWLSSFPNTGDFFKLIHSPDSPVSGTPEINGYPVSRTPEINGYPVSRMPGRRDSPASGTPDSHINLEIYMDSPVSRTPVICDSPASGTPGNHLNLKNITTSRCPGCRGDAENWWSGQRGFIIFKIEQIRHRIRAQLHHLKIS